MTNFSFHLGNLILSLESKTVEYTIIPLRCDVIKYCITNSKDECMVLNEEVCERVIVASLLVTPDDNKIPVRLLNVNEREVRLRNFQPKVESISNYEVYHYDSNKISVNRVDKVLDLINILAPF